jgi:hypothetical protein
VRGRSNHLAVHLPLALGHLGHGGFGLGLCGAHLGLAPHGDAGGGELLAQGFDLGGITGFRGTHFVHAGV